MEARTPRIRKSNPRFIDSSESEESQQAKRIVQKTRQGKQNTQKTNSKDKDGSVKVHAVPPKTEQSTQKTTSKEIDGSVKVHAAQAPKTVKFNGKMRKKKRNKVIKFHFTIDCSDVNQMDVPALGEYLLQKMPIFRRTKAKNQKLILTSESVFQKSSLKYWTKKYITENVPGSIEVNVTSKRSFQLKNSPPQ